MESAPIRLTKHAHACVTLEKEGSAIVIDPGSLTPDAAQVVAGASAILITHEHADHVADDVVTAALAADPDLVVHCTSVVAEKLGGPSDRVRVVAAGDTFEAGGFRVAVHGGRHAEIHRDIPCVDNVGYLIDDVLLHPGDAYHAPGVPIDTLLLPTSGPWTKLSEAADFVRAVQPRQMIQIHELLLSEMGQGLTAMLLGEGGLTGIPLTIMAVGDTTTVGGE